MSADQIGQFMAAIRALESSDNYGAVGPTHPQYGRALGAYQIMEANWASWAKSAGIPGADWRDPAAQDKVARHQMLRYFNTYGSWDLVAIAWFAGPGNAAKAKRYGLDAVGGLQDVLGTSVKKYVQMMNSNFGEAPSAGAEYRWRPFGHERINPFYDEQRSLQEMSEPTRVDPKRMLRAIFEGAANATSGGMRSHIDEVAPKANRLEVQPIEPIPSGEQQDEHQGAKAGV